MRLREHTFVKPSTRRSAFELKLRMDDNNLYRRFCILIHVVAFADQLSKKTHRTSKHAVLRASAGAHTVLELIPVSCNSRALE